MESTRPLRIGINCYPSVGGSGIIATTLGIELAARGHEVHFISYERPFRLPENAECIYFHPVTINNYELFKYPDYTLPLSVKMAEVVQDHKLDILHVHYAVPHATAAVLARCMLPESSRPRIITTLHGTDSALLGSDPNYAPAIQYALKQSDKVTTVSNYLKLETQRVLNFDGPIEVIYNFFEPGTTSRNREQVRRELGIRDTEVMIVHSSNLRKIKRIDLLLQTAAKIQARDSFKLVILAGGNFEPYRELVNTLDLQNNVIVLENVPRVEDYLQAADLTLYTSANESFCLSILEGMFFGCPSVATEVGGIPEVITNGETGLLVPSAEALHLSAAVERLIHDTALRRKLGSAAQLHARTKFSTAEIIPQYEALYRTIL